MVRVTNIGGPGAQTTGNGILVVNAISGATTLARSVRSLERRIARRRL